MSTLAMVSYGERCALWVSSFSVPQNDEWYNDQGHQIDNSDNHQHHNFISRKCMDEKGRFP